MKKHAVEINMPGIDSSDEDEFTGGEREVEVRTTRRMRTTTLRGLWPLCGHLHHGNAKASAGFTILDECPPLTTSADLQSFIGKLVLVGHDSKGVHRAGYPAGLWARSTLVGRSRRTT